MPTAATPPEARVIRFRKATRVALVFGFGAMLAVLVIASVDFVAQLSHLRTITMDSNRRFLENDRLLDQLRLTFFSMGTHLRDYLLDPNPVTAELSLATLQTQRADLKQILTNYRAAIPKDDQLALTDFERNQEQYWQLIVPVLGWNHERRQKEGFGYLQQRVFPARSQLMALTNELAHLNEMRMRSAEGLFAETFRGVRVRMLVTTAGTLSIGLLLCVATTLYILRLERHLADRYLEINQARGQLEELSAGIVDAQEKERRGISRELHDEIGQSLSALLVDVGNAAALADNSNPALVERLNSVRSLAESSLQSVRNMALLLRPSMLDDFGLIPALRWQAREFLRRHSVEVEVKASDTADQLPDAVNTCVYRVVQETLNNIARHAQATHVSVFVRTEPRRVLVAIQDDGRGFNPATERGLGLLGIEERARHLGGLARIESAPGKGTLVQVELPLQEVSA